MHKGARFFRCDFQVHTPRDEQWQGARPTNDDERRAWAFGLLAACRRLGLHAIAITDHHDTVMQAFAREAAAQGTDENGVPLPEDQRVIVFPGIEVTLSLPCQALILFDADLPSSFLDQLPGALGYTPSAANDERAARVEKLPLRDPNEISERLDALTYLRGRYIVLPHVQENGWKTILRSGFDAHYREFRGVGGYVDGTMPAIGTGARNILDGGDRRYGSKPLAVFQTSDCRQSDFAKLGTHSTWVKWSHPTAEALRQSCLARQSRISQDPPQVPSISITRIEVTASKFLGKRNLFLSPQYNALIGGRGTGKSTLLEYAKWALCVPTQPPNGDTLPDHERRSRALIENTLAEVKGSVRVGMDIRGVPHVVERRSVGSPSVHIKVADEPFRTSTEEEIRRLMPVEAYSQKHLSSIGGTPSDILQFVLSSVGREVAEINDQIDQANDDVRRSFAALRAIERATAEATRLRGELESLTKQRTVIQAQLVSLNPADAALLRNADGYAAERAVREKWVAELAAVREATERTLRLVETCPTPAPKIDLPHSDLTTAMHASLAAFYDDVTSRLRELVEQFDSAEALQHFGDRGTELDDALRAAREQFRVARERASAHEAAIKQAEQLSARISSIGSRLEELEIEIEGVEDARKEFATASKATLDLIAKRGAITSQRCRSIETESQMAIRGVLRPGADLTQAMGLLSDSARGSRVTRERFDGIKRFVQDATDPIGTWAGIVDELRQLLGVTSDHPTLPAAPLLHAAGFNDKELRALAGKLDDESWLRLRVTTPADFVAFEYRTRDSEYIPFSQASAGQRATALMRVLLAEGGAPLIVDQPEDDLDNKVIHEIASDIWNAKTRRQLIFASHNANLVVNGDADLVIVFDYLVSGEQTAGDVREEGSIDDEGVRSAIAEVMEGGRDAFRLRRDKYGF